MARGTGRKDPKPGTFGSVHQLPSGRYRASYYGPDGRRYKAPTTFTAQKAARSWLALRQSEIISKAWMPPDAPAAAPIKKVTLREYADEWLPKRKVRGQPLKQRTREHYRGLLNDHILPTLGGLPVAAITRDDVESWYDKLGAQTPTLRAHCYGLLKTILSSAVSDGKAAVNPCVLRGAGTVKRASKTKPATLAELETITAEMPAKYQAMILLASWCALRFGELTELRRKDVDTDEGVIRVRRAVVRTEVGFKIEPPKSDAGVRDVAVPPHMMTALKNHMDKYVASQPNSLLFPADHGGHLAPATFYRWYYKARANANREDLRFHDLRHTGAVLAAQTGATLAELMARLGHSTPAAAMRYQHAAQGADRRIADLLSKIAAGEA
ncbi:tyrosine-type recombinase/integrase [Mycolicibacterium sp. S3B2]|uniref:tyrosine-type recombinase/integrase n=1 Tax=Mycolicibacterium sp. S3B2 TaxID=3415120 RepID=UPI003C7E1E19